MISVIKKVKINVVENDNELDGCIVDGQPHNSVNTVLKRCCDSRFDQCKYSLMMDIETNHIRIMGKYCLFDYRRNK